MSDDRPDIYQGIARGLDQILNGGSEPKKIGFAVLIFEFGKFEGGRVNYVSNADRETMITACKEWIARHEGRVIETEQRQ